MRANPKTFAKDINKRTPIADYVATMRNKINTAIAEMISADTFFRGLPLIINMFIFVITSSKAKIMQVYSSF